MEQQTKTCKYCKTEIAVDAKICPHCRKKQGVKTWIIVLIVFFCLYAIGRTSQRPSYIADNTPTTSPAIYGEVPQEQYYEKNAENNTTKTTNQNNIANEEKESSPYIKCDFLKMINDLESNALKANNDYNGKKIEITGKISTIDSSGDYISIIPSNKEFSFNSILCDITTETQLNQIMNKTEGEIITIRGTVTVVGEILGYSMDIDEIL